MVFCNAVAEIEDFTFLVDVAADEIVCVAGGTVKLMPALLQKASAKSTVSAVQVRAHCADARSRTNFVSLPDYRLSRRLEAAS